MEKDDIASIFCLIYCAFQQEMYPEDNDIAPTSQKHCSRRPKAMLREAKSIALELTKHCSRTCRALFWSIKSIVLEHAEQCFSHRKRMMTTVVARYC